MRIANCLTSLDDLIAAHSAKLEALKTHKKGLMQQLSPPEEVKHERHALCGPEGLGGGLELDLTRFHGHI